MSDNDVGEGTARDFRPLWTTWHLGEIVGASEFYSFDPPPDAYEVALDPEPRASKPDKDATRAVNSRIVRCATVTDSYLIAQELSRGCTILPGICAPRRKAECWQRQTVFMIDFDNDPAMLRRGFQRITIRQALRRAYRAGFRPLLAYPSFSSPVALWEPGAYEDGAARFRLAVDAGRSFSDPGERDSFASDLAALYPEADPSSLERNRMFYGTDKGVVECRAETRF